MRLRLRKEKLHRASGRTKRQHATPAATTPPLPEAIGRPGISTEGVGESPTTGSETRLGDTLWRRGK